MRQLNPSEASFKELNNLSKNPILHVPMVQEKDRGIVVLVPDGPAHGLVHRLHAQVLVVDLP